MFELCFGCECCDKDLLFDLVEVCICIFECMFCVICVDDVLKGCCLNCGGDLVVCLWWLVSFFVKYLLLMECIYKLGGCVNV